MAVPNFNIGDLIEAFKADPNWLNAEPLIDYWRSHPRKWKSTVRWALGSDNVKAFEHQLRQVSNECSRNPSQ